MGGYWGGEWQGDSDWHQGDYEYGPLRSLATLSVKKTVNQFEDPNRFSAIAEQDPYACRGTDIPIQELIRPNRKNKNGAAQEADS